MVLFYHQGPDSSRHLNRAGAPAPPHIDQGDQQAQSQEKQAQVALWDQSQAKEERASS